MNVPVTGSSAAGPHADDAAIVAGLRAKTDEAFEQLVRAHAGRLLAVARRMLGNHCDAEDAVQDALLQAYRSIDGFEGRSRLGTWLHRITVNVALSRLRSRTGTRECNIESLLPAYYDDGHRKCPLPAWTETVDELLDRREVCHRLQTALATIPDAYRDVVLLRDVEGLDSEQTAAALGVSVAAAKTRLHRARQAVRTLLERDLSGGAT